MEFSNLNFIFRFLPVFLLVYFMVPQKIKNVVLFIGSIVFYAVGEPWYVLLILLSVTVNYIGGLALEGYEGQIRRKQLTLWVLLISDVALLVFFKYSGYAMPLGISFYTFTVISYVLDIYMGKAKAQRSLVRAGIYMMFFPKMISGPIVAYRDMKPYLKKRRISLAMVEEGLVIFTEGLLFKVFLANHFGMLWHDIQSVGYDGISTQLAWIGAAGYSAQLFFDFQGYSLMAIGIAWMLGFPIAKNFDHPYRSGTVAEYYRRWHISLGQWFKNYVYIPLGGNRRGELRTILNLLVVWLLTGLWHGVTANFLLWGLVLFCFIACEKLFLKKFLDAHKLLSHLYIWFVIPLTWVVFAIDDIKQVGVYFMRLFPFWGTPDYVNALDYVKYLRNYSVFFVIALLVSLPVADKLYERLHKTVLFKAIILILFWFGIYEVVNGMNNPFLYFRF